METPLASPALSARQMRFALAYGQGYTAVEAAIMAGYTPGSARANAHRLLKNKAISALAQDETQRLHLEQRPSTDYFLICITGIMLDQDAPVAQRLKATAQYLAYLKLCARNRPALPPDVRQAIKTLNDAEVPEPPTTAQPPQTEAKADTLPPKIVEQPTENRPSAGAPSSPKPGRFSQKLKQKLAAKQRAGMGRAKAAPAVLSDPPPSASRGSASPVPPATFTEKCDA